jgi:preprotein translocase subunit SecA
VWKLLTQVFGSRNQRLVKELSRTVTAVNDIEAKVELVREEAGKRRQQRQKQ